MSDPFLFLYGLGWKAARPFLRRNKRLADAWDTRLAPKNWADPCDLWIQAASGGEAYLADSLLRRIPERRDMTHHPGPLRVLLTTWTRQGMDVLNKIRDDLHGKRADLAVQTAFFPLDDPSIMHRAVNMISPRAVVLLETELWPSLLHTCAEAHIPVFVINGRITEKSLRNYQKIRFLAPNFWHDTAPRCIGALSQEDAARFAALFNSSKINIIPNIKFDRAHTDTKPNISSAARILPHGSNTRILLLASVREEEEQILLPAVAGMKCDSSHTVIVAPRHIHRADAWLEALSRAGMKPIRRTALSADNPAPAGSIVIWDTFGELTALYALCDTVFVGGSLAPLGGQNMLEPLGCGRIPVVGPYTKNFVWATDGKNGLIRHRLLTVCPDAESMMSKLAEQPADPTEIKARFDAWLAPHLGGVDQSVAVLMPYLH